MNEVGLVSVIIPTTRYDGYLRDAVESVLTDGWQSLEVIVVLDGQHEPAPLWLQRPEIRLVSTGLRSGSAAAINLGIKECRGEFLARLDADDLTMPGRFEKQIKFLKENPEVLLVGARAQIIDSTGSNLGPFGLDHPADPRMALLRRNPFVHSSFFIKTRTLRDVGCYDESCVRMQDYELLLRIAMRGDLAIIDETLVKYRVHDSQNSTYVHGFVPLMVKLSTRKRNLARFLGKRVAVQVIYDLFFAIAQVVRYLGWRQPRYLKPALATRQ